MMRLITEKGALDLPGDYSIVMKRTNPLLSDEGDASIPAALPSSIRNLANLRHLERIDSANRHFNQINAILEAGPVRKRGVLVVDTVHPDDGIEASFAIDNSDMYVKAKNKTLKEIFKDYKQEFESIKEACLYMEEVYLGAHQDEDYMIFPVAVSPYEENDVKQYQYNNQIEISGNTHSLVYNQRTVHEDGDIVGVHEGYGVAPFLKLYRLVEILFEILEYEILENCLTTSVFQNMVVVHNCSDCLVSPVLRYRDLVPSMKLSEFLKWLNCKFHVQPMVDSERKSVRIVFMENLLASGADKDLSGLVDGGFTMNLNRQKRIVLSSTTKIEGSEPAADTFDNLLQKYTMYREVNEAEYDTLSTNFPVYEFGLLLRKATGDFYVMEYDENFMRSRKRHIGTNYFTYDRANSEETEEFPQADSIPPMIRPGKDYAVMPFIGERTHSHTSYKGSATDANQDLILVQAVTSQDFFYYTTGTTQDVIPTPNANTDFMSLGFGITPYSMYKFFWRRYNNILLNNPVHLTGDVQLPISDLLGMDLAKLKLFEGQRMLPVSLEGNIGAKKSMSKCEFILVKRFVDETYDSVIIPGELSLTWDRSNDAADVAEALGHLEEQEYEPGYYPSSPLIDGGIEYRFWNFIGDAGEPMDPGIPEYEGQTVNITRQKDLRLFFWHYYTDPYDPSYNGVMEHRDKYNNTITYTFVAVPV